MADLQAPSAIAGLRPPRKSIELEDPGAHYLGMSLLNIIYLFFYYKALISVQTPQKLKKKFFLMHRKVMDPPPERILPYQLLGLRR